ncbi:MAG: WD40 repeat domain-containing protein, partial [Verrucomicrobiales bacterium]|nr:WD40 repeat domain-containing protein [Verrucomicrobiales bacterium]
MKVARQLSDAELQRQRRRISLGLRRLNTAAMAILVVILALAVATILALQRSERLRARAELAESNARLKLYEAQVFQARAERSTDSMGRRHRSLNAIAAAAELLPALPVADSTPLRNEATASLALADFELSNTLGQITSVHTAFHFAPALDTYVIGHTNGDVTLHRFGDGALALWLRSPGQAGAVSYAKFSPDGQRLAVAYKTGSLFLFSPGTNTPPVPVGAASVRDSRQALQFSGDGRWLGVLTSDGRAQIFDCTKVAAPFGEFAHVNALAFHPKTNCLALSIRTEFRFADFGGRDVIRPITNAPAA